MNWRLLVVVACIAVACVAIVSSKDDIDRYINESMLESMSNGVITLDEESRIVTCNAAGLKILQVELPEIVNNPGREFFKDKNSWMMDMVQRVGESAKPLWLGFASRSNGLGFLAERGPQVAKSAARTGD